MKRKKIRIRKEVMTGEEFKKALLESERTNFDGVVVEGDLVFKDITRSHLYITGITIKGQLIFYSNVVLEDRLVIDHTTIEESLALEALTANNLCLMNTIVKKALFLGDERRSVTTNNLFLMETTVEGDIFCGKNVTLALQCFLYFGNRVCVETESIKKLLQVLPQALETVQT